MRICARRQYALACLAVAVLSPCSASSSEKLSIAAAANLTYCIESLNVEFSKLWPAMELVVSTGASGSFFAQIKHGAPYDVFLSADMDYPRQLVRAGLAESDSLTVFAIGRLVLWTTNEGVDVKSKLDVVRSPAVHRIAIANPMTAPYGRVARQALEQAGLWTVAEPKIVTGENVTQTAQFVETGGADIGFVALALVMSPRLKDKGWWVEIPVEAGAGLEHGAVVTKRGAGNPAARSYLAFLKSPPAREVFARFGYRQPD